MRIEDSTVNMYSRYISIKESTVTEKMELWVDDSGNEASQKGYIVQVSEQAKQLNAATQIKTRNNDEYLELNDQDKTKIQLVEKIIEMITGKKVKIMVPKIKKDCHGCENGHLHDSLQVGNERQLRAGWGLSYDYHETYFESEKVSFTAEGLINTVDGKKITFSVDLNISRKFYQESSSQIRLGDAVKTDPLVINFDGKAADLTQTRYSFDLDGDGSAEQISFIKQGSGFLALDRNGDGRINDGGELFGPASGNGFVDLAKYDEDGDNWIDEDDSIYHKLRIWTKDEHGKDQLFSLGQKGIGAVYIGWVKTPFELKDGQNNSLGELAGTGIYINENGTVGTVQQVNLVV